ncbi:hypothetical protein OIU84_025907 [Salix udensis]|uniref:Ammonium transporter AmtB-like domain-containing protein n=1 Tax=Salix udensis TaxID=889485 RepID=A0AAD6KKN5_9ROSI|nr:hypothetical protein OIU84_025907 [Salix udensis]
MDASAYGQSSPSVPDWLNKGDNAWQMIAATLVATQSMPGLVILYASIVKKKWAVNSAFMALYAFAAVLICWVLLGYRMAFGDELLPFWGKGAPALGQDFLKSRARIPESTHTHEDGTKETVGPRIKSDRERFPPNNVLLMLAGAGLLWMGWSGFNGGAPYAANIDASIAILNTNVCAATSLLVWTSLDVIYFGKPSVIGAVQGMMTGLVCITPGAGLVQSWAAIVMGILSGSIPWVSMMVLHKKSALLQKVDDTLGVFHTHAVAGLLGGLLTGLLAEPELCALILPEKTRGAFYGGNGGVQFLKQMAAASFVISWNIVSTTLILLFIRLFIPLRMPEEELQIGDDAVHGEEAYALWGDGEKYDPTKHGRVTSLFGEENPVSRNVNDAVGVTINL